MVFLSVIMTVNDQTRSPVTEPNQTGPDRGFHNRHLLCRKRRDMRHDVDNNLTIQCTKCRHVFARLAIENLVHDLPWVAHLFGERFAHVLGSITVGTVAV